MHILLLGSVMWHVMWSELGWCGFRELFWMASQSYSALVTIGFLLHTFLSTVRDSCNPPTHSLLFFAFPFHSGIQLLGENVFPLRPIPVLISHPRYPPLSHTRTHIRSRHVPNCVSGTASGSSVPWALVPLAAGHVGKGNNFYEFVRLPPILAEKWACVGVSGENKVCHLYQVVWCSLCVFVRLWWAEGRRQAGGRVGSWFGFQWGHVRGRNSGRVLT